MNTQRLSSVCDAPLARWMLRLLSLALIASTFFSGFHHPARAQSTDLTVSVEDVDTSSFPATQIRVSVRDKNGVPVQGLTTEHFEIVEDGAAAHRPTAVEMETNPEAQVSLAIVIDLYRTLQGEPIAAAQEATQQLVTDLLDEPNDEDRAAFVGVRQGLSTDPTVIDETYEVPFTNDRNKLLNVINFLHERVQESGPGTPLYDAVIKAVRMAEATEPVAHRAVIAMTDGGDGGSVNEDSDTIQRASDARTPVFTVGLSNNWLDEQYLRRLAENSGGTYQRAESPDDLSSLFANVLTMLRTQYVVSYDAALPQDGQAHSLLVRVRTPTQLEGFQEYRIQTPGGAAEVGQGEGEEETASTSEPPLSDAQADPEPEPAEDDEGWFAATRDWVEDNLLLAAVGIGALLLVFLALAVIAIVVVRRRRAGMEGGVEPLEVPSYPAAPEYDFGPEPGARATRPEDADFSFGGPESLPQRGPQPTMMDDDGAFGAGSPPRYEAPPAAPPGVSQPAFQPSTADRTRILHQQPKMSTVGLLIDRDQPANRLDVAQPVVTVGRSPESDVLVEHNTVSRQHAVIKFEEGRFRLYDMASTNGTFVEGHRIQEPVFLDDSTVVTFGEKPFIFKVIALGT